MYTLFNNTAVRHLVAIRRVKTSVIFDLVRVWLNVISTKQLMNTNSNY